MRYGLDGSPIQPLKQSVFIVGILLSRVRRHRLAVEGQVETQVETVRLDFMTTIPVSAKAHTV